MTTETRITLLPGQERIIRNFHDPILAVVAGTGGGKTTTGYFWLWSRMEAYPGYTWGMAEPSYPMLDKVILNSSDPDRPTLEQFLQKIGHHPIYSKGERIMKTDFGQIYLYTAENPLSMQGAPLKGFWLDEPGQMQLLAHETALQRISMMQGQELLTTTPYNLGWLLTEIVNKVGQGIHVERWRSIDRPGFPRDRYEYMKAHLPQWRFRMLYDAQFERPAGLIYDSFDEATCSKNHQLIPTEWKVYVGHDFGIENPAAMFYAIDSGTGLIWAFAEYRPKEKKTIYQQVEDFKKITAGYNVVKRIGGSHQEEGWRGDYTAQGWPIQEPKENLRKVESRITRVYALHKLNKIMVFSDLYNYLDEKRSFSHKLNAQNEVTEEIEDEARFHLMSAEQYVLSDFTPETVAHGTKVSRMTGW